MCSQFTSRAFRIFVNAKRRPVETQRQNANRRVNELKSMAFELKIVDDLRQERPSTVGERGAKAGMEFFGNARTTDDRATFKHERFESRPREIESGDEAIVAGADDDDVVGFHPRFADPIERLATD